MRPLSVAESPALVEQRRLNGKLARARRRMLACPCVFYVRRFLYCLREAVALEHLLLMQVPTAHDEAVYALSQSNPSALS